MKTKLLIVVMPFVFFLSSFQLSLSAESDLERNERIFTQYFDTTIEIVFHTTPEGNPETILAGLEDLLSELHKIADRFELYDGVTNVKTINENPSVPHEVDARLFEMIAMGKEYHDLTNGYFNIALGPVIDIWQERLDMCEGLRCELPTDVLPTAQELEQADAHTDIEGITLDEENLTVMIEEGMSLDLGGIAKGYGAKLAAEYLKDIPYIEAFILNAGTSNIEVYGPNPRTDDGLWVIDVIDPTFEPDFWSVIRGEREYFARLSLQDGDSIVSSGNYERYFDVDGVRYHHLIDPFTLHPTGTLEEEERGNRFIDWLLCRRGEEYPLGVWMTTDDPLVGDILVTAAYLMPIEESLAYVEELDDMEALYYTNHGRILTTSGFTAEYFGNHAPQELDERSPCIAPIIVGGGVLLLAGAVTLFVLKIRSR